MKLDWIKEHWLVAVLGLAFLAATGFGAWGWHQADSANSKIDTSIADQATKVDSLKKSKPFPSPQNLDTVRQDLRQLESLYKQLQAGSAKPVEVPALKPDQFVSRRARTLPRLRTLARNAGVSLPDGNFTFGIEKLDEQPKPDDVPALTKQLIVTEALCTNLFATGIKDLSEIKWDNSHSTSNALFMTMTYDLKFGSATTNLCVFINKLQDMPWLFSIRSVTIEAKPVTASAATAPSPTGMPYPNYPPSGFPPGIPTGPGRPFLPPGVTPPPAVPPTETEPATTTPQREQLPANILNVVMRVDLIEPLPPPALPSTPKPPGTRP